MMWDGLRDLAAINGPAIDDPAGLPQTLNLSFHGCRTDLLLMALDQAGIAASAGSACASGAITPSPVLKAMGLGDDRVRSAIRFSWTRQMTDEEMRSAIGIVRGCVATVG
jgi:cysteine desulfurase